MQIVLWGFQYLEYKEGGKVTTLRREILNLERLTVRHSFKYVSQMVAGNEVKVLI